MKRQSPILVSALIIITAILLSFGQNLKELPFSGEGREFANVVRVIDGDTFVLEGESRVRLICIDTPERGEFYYEEATRYLESLALNKEVRLEKDVSETDRYGRLLRYVYIDDIFINEALVRGGYAQVYRFPPDTKYCDLFQEAEKAAKSEKLGIWS
jgi:micrococcal nuclease